MKIEYLKIKNFLSVGEDPVEIHFDKLGKIVLIEGINLDSKDISKDYEYSDKNNEHYSNASGKSSISEAVVYALYGSTVRKQTNHSELIHNGAKKRLEIEIIFSIDGVRYRIVRTRKPDSLRLWQGGPTWIDAPEPNNNEMTKGGQPATQNYIENSILKLNHKAFVNVVCFGQHNDYNFLDCTAAEQREIAESLLNLSVYEQYASTAKDDLKNLKTSVKEMMLVYEQVAETESNMTRRLSDLYKQQESWQSRIQLEIDAIKQRIDGLHTQMLKSDYGESLALYDDAQTKIEKYTEAIKSKEVNLASLEHAASEAKNRCNEVEQKIHEQQLQRRSIEADVQDQLKEKSKNEKSLKQLDNLQDGAKCPHCFGPIDKQHYKHVIQLCQNKIDACNAKIPHLSAQIELKDVEIAKLKSGFAQIKYLRDSANDKCNEIKSDLVALRAEVVKLSKVQRPEMSSKEIIFKEKIESSQDLLWQKQEEQLSGGPYKEIIASIQNDIDVIKNKQVEYRAEIDKKELLIPYYDYWRKTFSDHIRSFIISGIVPALNARIAYWCQYLMKGTRKVSFGDQLNVKIESGVSEGNTISYSVTCGSERKRINLAISQAFAHIMTLSSGTFPSVVFLDEISDSIDHRGLRNFYQMICELSKEKQVFVITHNTHLKQMLEGVDTITMKKENDISRLVKV